MPARKFNPTNLVVVLALLVLGHAQPTMAQSRSANPSVVTQDPGSTTRVSVASDGTQANGDSSWFTEPHFSGDARYVVFASSASNLVPDDTNGADIFVHDRQTSQTTRVSVASDGTQANGSSGGPSISADGRYVAFHSISSNLVDGDTNNKYDVFVHDRLNGQTIRVSVASDGSQGAGSDGHSLWPSISADGRYVAFTSRAFNLVPGDTNPGCEPYYQPPGQCADTFVHDRLTGQTTRVSVATDGTQGNADSYSVPTISTDGRYVAFESVASTLVPNDTNSSSDVFVHDQQTGQTTRVSVTSDGMEANSVSAAASISGDGRYIAFYSGASNLVSGRGAGIYVHDLLTGQMTFASLASDGTSIDYVDGDTAISTDGRFVAFEAFAIGVFDVYLRDLVAAQTTRISVTFNGVQANGDSRFPGLSADGRYVGFTSRADNIVQGDTNGYADVFVHEQGDLSLTYSISGQVRDNGNNPLPGVTISDGAGHTTTTGSDGSYTLSGLPTGTHTITPSQTGYTFSPSSLTVTVPPNATGQDFAGTKPVIDYFALGDSIASGHGLTDDGSACRRSNRSYPHKVIELLATRYDTVNWTILACSGATARKPDATTLDQDPNKWLQNQVDYVLAHLSDRPTLVSITIGVNDFDWSDLNNVYNHLAEDNGKFTNWADQRVEQVKRLVRTQVVRLLNQENVTVVITEYHNPFNTNSILFQAQLFKKKNLRCVFDGCYPRTEYVVHRLNGAFIDIQLEIQLELGHPSRLQVAAVHEKFHLDGGHESPRTGSAVKTCGFNAPEIADTWVQYPSDPESNSNPPLPEEIRRLTGPWKGDCFHPNEEGASMYADAVNNDAVRVGR